MHFVLFVNNVCVAFDELIAMVAAGMGQKSQALLNPFSQSVFID